MVSGRTSPISRYEERAANGGLLYESLCEMGRLRVLRPKNYNDGAPMAT